MRSGRRKYLPQWLDAAVRAGDATQFQGLAWVKITPSLACRTRWRRPPETTTSGRSGLQGGNWYQRPRWLQRRLFSSCPSPGYVRSNQVTRRVRPVDPDRATPSGGATRESVITRRWWVCWAAHQVDQPGVCGCPGRTRSSPRALRFKAEQDCASNGVRCCLARTEDLQHAGIERSSSASVVAITTAWTQPSAEAR